MVIATMDAANSPYDFGAPAHAEIRRHSLVDTALVREGAVPKGFGEPYSIPVLKHGLQACRSCPEVVPWLSTELKTLFSSA